VGQLQLLEIRDLVDQGHKRLFRTFLLTFS